MSLLHGAWSTDSIFESIWFKCLINNLTNWPPKNGFASKMQVLLHWSNCKFLNKTISRVFRSQINMPIPSMGLSYLATWMVDFYGFHVGKYTVRPMDPSWDVFKTPASNHWRSPTRRPHVLPWSSSLRHRCQPDGRPTVETTGISWMLGMNRTPCLFFWSHEKHTMEEKEGKHGEKTILYLKPSR